MQVCKFAPFAREANAAVAMPAGPDARNSERSNFQRLQGREFLPLKQRCPCQQQRVKNVRRERQVCQPAQSPDDEFEDHGWISARRLISRITRICTAPKISWVHQSKYHAGRTCREYHVRPMSVVVPSPLS